MKELRGFLGKLKRQMKSNNHLLGTILPGVLLCLVMTIFGIYAADLLGVFIVYIKILPEGSTSPVSGIFIAILLGIIVRNTIGLSSVFMKGVKFSLKYALRAGIILLGLRLSLAEAPI